MPILGWIYEPEDSTVRKAIVEKALEESLELQVSGNAEATFAERLDLLIADNDGHFSTTLTIPAGDIGALGPDRPLHSTAVTHESETRSFVGIGGQACRQTE